MTSYETRFAELSKIIAPFEVHVRSDRFWKSGRKDILKFTDEHEMREAVAALVSAARIAYEEEIYQPRYVDDLTGIIHPYSYEEIFRDYGSPLFGKGWMIEVYRKIRPDHSEEHPVFCDEWMYGHRFGANQVANPASKVFVSYGGRDCDGYRWHSMQEYASLREAADDCESRQYHADGPMSWSIVSRDEYEAYGN